MSPPFKIGASAPPSAKPAPAPAPLVATNTITIDRDVPIPAGRHTTETFPFKNMKPGDSIFVPGPSKQLAQSASYYGKLHGLIFTTRTVTRGGGSRRPLLACRPEGEGMSPRDTQQRWERLVGRCTEPVLVVIGAVLCVVAWIFLLAAF